MSQQVIDAIVAAINDKLPGAQAEVNGGQGHYTIAVTSDAFAGKSMVQSHQLVYQAIAHLMKGEGAPVHAIDRLVTTH
ncbi:MAG: BolA/IbaG family iron-sulfur metabolism protein [Deltaproteobacteria bacterium]|nr:BolA/IbaG family iron-sulfur metabolism protein [Deltaproteobacteria bacterium]